MSLLDHDLLVVRQRTKLIELTNQYDLLDADGTTVGTVEQVGQTTLRKAVRLLGRIDQFLTHRLEVREADGTVALVLVRPAKLMKSKVEVADGAGAAVGSIVQRNVIGKIRFGLVGPGGEELGEIRGENWRQWDFAVVDTRDHEVGRITKQWRGLLREGFTTADSWLVSVEAGLDGPLRALVVASGAAVDTALKQDE
ncbi:MAG: phospholipid scramblase-related protein [Acidimicrobiia bacterium]